MTHQTIQPFMVIGIAVRTTNENNQAANDIQALWGKFMLEGISEKIPNRIDNTIYSIYTDYEKDHTKPYTTLLGCKVSNLDTIPAGMTGKKFDGGKYIVHHAKGNILKGAIFDAWVKIWNSDLDRTYTADFEVYGEKAQNPADAEVDIFIAVK